MVFAGVCALNIQLKLRLQFEQEISDSIMMLTEPAHGSWPHVTDGDCSILIENYTLITRIPQTRFHRIGKLQLSCSEYTIHKTSSYDLNRHQLCILKFNLATASIAS